MERKLTWQHVALVALRAALLAVLTLLGDRLAGGVPSDLIVRALAVPVPAVERLRLLIPPTCVGLRYGQ